jgi:hypothetical protein
MEGIAQVTTYEKKLRLWHRYCCPAWSALKQKNDQGYVILPLVAKCRARSARVRQKPLHACPRQAFQVSILPIETHDPNQQSSKGSLRNCRAHTPRPHCRIHPQIQRPSWTPKVCPLLGIDSPTSSSAYRLSSETRFTYLPCQSPQNARS